MIKGRFFPPGAAQAADATLWGGPDRLNLRIEGEDTVRNPQLAHLSDRLGKVPRKFTFDDGSVFEAPPDADVDGLMRTGGSFFSRLSRLEASWKFVAFAALATIILLAGIYRYGIPLAASGAAALTPPVVIQAMDRGTRETVDRTFFSESKLSEARKEDLRAVFIELAGHSGMEPDELRLLFRDGGPLGANAFALPGGTIVMTDQLVERADSEDELAGVMAHEIGHVQGRHSLQQIYRVLGLGFMIGLIGGDSSQIVDDVVTQAAALQQLAYTREFEEDADRRSVEIMVRAGRDPLAFVDLLDRIVGEDGAERETNWMSTHPGNRDRREVVTELARELGWEG